MISAALQATPPSYGNQLLAGLPGSDRMKLLARGRQIEVRGAEKLCTAGERVRHIYFPISGVIALTTQIASHPSLAVGLIGDEGMVGIWPVLGINTSPVNAEVQIGGMAWRVDVAPFCREVGGGTALRRRLDRYLYVLLTQRAQTAICAYFHVVEERLARWFLMTRDRAHSDEFHLTHEQMSGILGVRRAGITRAAIALQARSLIRYSRGEVRILDGEGLEAAACECYASDRRIYAHGLS